MSLFIWELGALAKLARVEGDKWVDAQRKECRSKYIAGEHPNPYSYAAHLTAWAFCLAYNAAAIDEDDLILLEDLPSDKVSGVIYGDGGLNRYAVDGTGELALLASSATVQAIELAQSVGIKIVGH